MKIPHIPGDDVIRRLSRELYPNGKIPFREFATNAFDENSDHVIIRYIRDSKGMLTIEIEDFGNGIADPQEFLKYGHSDKQQQERYVKSGREIIGSKGLGKLSMLKLQDEIIFETNNGKEDYVIKMFMPPEENDVQPYYPGKILPHTGTKAIIKNPFANEVPKFSELQDFLEYIFSLRLKRGQKITMEAHLANTTPVIKQLKPSLQRINPEEKFLFRLPGGLGDITGNLEMDVKKGKGFVDVLCKHVYVCRLEVDEHDPRRFSGWINFNGLELTTNRQEIIENSLYKYFIEHLRDHTKRFPKINVDPLEVTKEEKILSKELDGMLKDYLTEYKLLVGGSLISMPMLPKPTHQETETISDVKRVGCDTAQPGDNVEGTIKSNNHRTTDPGKPDPPTTINNKGGEQRGIYATQDRIKKIPSKFADFRWARIDAGNEKDPIYQLDQTTIVQNIGNDIWKYANNTKEYLGAKWLRLIPYMSRMVVKMHPKYKEYTKEETSQKEDEATRFFLKQKGLIP